MRVRNEPNHALFGANPGTTISGNVMFSEPTKATQVVISDLAPNTAFGLPFK